MKKESLWNLIGLILGLAIVIAGVIFAAAPADSYHTSSPKSAEFGADFYTYQYDATRIAADNAAVTANNIRELGHAIALYTGFSFIFAGLLIAVHFGKKVFCSSFILPEIESPETAAVETEAPDEYTSGKADN